MANYTIKLERNNKVIKFNVRTYLTDFRDIMQHVAGRRYGKKTWCQFDEYSRVRFFKLNRDGSSDAVSDQFVASIYKNGELFA